MFQSSVPVTEPSAPYHDYGRNQHVATTANPAQADQDLVENQAGFLSGVARRWRRERRRRKVGRAYDMALEITRALQRIPHGASVLDVGCGNGYIAHHLSGLLGTRVMGIDLDQSTEARIDYRPFDGTCFPV